MTLLFEVLRLTDTKLDKELKKPPTRVGIEPTLSRQGITPY